MRKFAIILLGLFACLLCGRGTETVCAHPDLSTDSLIITLDHNASDEWLCEWEYNSDLGMPRVSAEGASAIRIPLSFRDGRAILRAGIKCGVASGHEGVTVSAGSRLNFKNISPGLCVVDYYVYRLCRIII